MTIRVSVNYSDLRWKRFDLTSCVKLLLSKVLQVHQMSFSQSSLSILACSDKKIKELNRIHRRKNKVTNVLAWPATSGFLYLGKINNSTNRNNYLFLGDIAISYETCLREAWVQDARFEKHCCKLLVHAILHLLGYNHDKSTHTIKMQLMENRVLNSVLTNRPKSNNI